MNTPENNASGQPLGLASSEGLGPEAPKRTEWAEVADALKREYGHLLHFRGLPRYDFSRHVYVGRAGALLLVAEKQEAALREAIATLERDGDEWGICDRLRAALLKPGPNVGGEAGP